jgi:glyoxylase-like metal-dependent hydrolase (beta-lactamase superfamily II)
VRPSDPHALPFAPDLHVRSFLLEREHGDLLVYAAPGDQPSGAPRRYLNHWHEAIFLDDRETPLFVNEHDREATEGYAEVAHVFSKRHVLDGDFEVIPTPGHTPGATAFLWDDGERRFLFTGDTIYLRDGEWVPAVLESSDPVAYAESLALLRELAFDVLVPWAATAGQPWYTETDRADARERIGALIDRVRNGGD